MSVATGDLRLNLGCGGYPMAGYLNIDRYCDADLQGDFTQMDFENVADVQMIHVLEHLPWVDAPAVLARIKGWLAPGGTITIEVPDMAAILRLGTENPAWNQWIYGCQAHEGEYHRAGFSKDLLMGLLELLGYRIVEADTFLSDHPMRVGFPCLKIVAACD